MFSDRFSVKEMKPFFGQEKHTVFRQQIPCFFIFSVTKFSLFLLITSLRPPSPGHVRSPDRSIVIISDPCLATRWLPSTMLKDVPISTQRHHRSFRLDPVVCRIP